VKPCLALPLQRSVTKNADGRSMIGVLALQGSFSLHVERLRSMQVPVCTVRTPEDLASCSALILPGGESTSMLKLIDFQQLWDPLLEFSKTRPMIGICAGAILMAKRVRSPEQASLGIIDITAERNSYGRQNESAERSLRSVSSSLGDTLEAGVFIRAPRLFDLGPKVEAMVMEGSDVVCVRQGLHVAMSYHPELCADWKKYYLFFMNLAAL
jgi:pyridoxal 5'-phosphate synthase pdxT subunit